MDVIAEFVLESIEGEDHLSEAIADIVRTLKREGLDHQVTTSGTTIQGELNTVLDCIARCHEHLGEADRRVKSLVNLDTKADWAPGAIEIQAEKVTKQLAETGW